MELVRYGGGEAAVLNQGDPSGLILTLQPTDLAAVPVPQVGTAQIEWAPKDRRALDLEIRARLVNVSAATPPGTAPLVRWYADVGHGTASRRIPAPLAIAPAVVPSVANSLLPDRGLCVRINARQLRLTFVNAGLLGGGATGALELAVSIQPVSSMQLPRFVREQFYAPVAGAAVPAFPAEATEWRLRDLLSLPFTLGAATVQFTGVRGFPSGPVDAVDYSDWTPIPTIAAAWTCSLPAIAEYR